MILSDQVIDHIIVPHRENRELWRRETWRSPVKLDELPKLENHLSLYVQHYFRGVHQREIESTQAFDYAKRILEQAYQVEGGVAHALNLAKWAKIDDVIDVISGCFEQEVIKNSQRQP